MRIPLAWLRSYCDPGLSAEEIADALTMAGDKLERLHRTGVGDSGAGFVVGRVLGAERHPNADRLTVCEVDVGASAGPNTIVCGAPNVAAGQTVAVALPGAVMPDGSKLGEAKLRGVQLERDDPGRGRGRHRRRPRRDHGAALRAADRGPAARAPADRGRGPRARDHAEPPGHHERLRGGTRSARGHRRAARRGPGSGGRSGSRRRHGGRPRGGRDRPRDLPALHRARVRGREDRAVAAVAEAAPERGRTAADLERGRHHELRDARPRASRCTRSTSTRCAERASTSGARARARR